MTTKTEALTKALVALAKVDALCPVGSNAEIYVRDALDAIKEALAQPDYIPDIRKLVTKEASLPKQEPVAHIGMIDEEHFADVCRKAGGNSNTPLYTSPPARGWVGLTDKEFQWCADENWPMIRVAEMLKEKNT